MKSVHVRYRYEPEGWWAESIEAPGWTAVGGTFAEVRGLAREGILEFLGPNVLIAEEGIPIIAGKMNSGVGRRIDSQLRLNGGPVSATTYATSAVPQIAKYVVRSFQTAVVPDPDLAEHLGHAGGGGKNPS